MLLGIIISVPTLSHRTTPVCCLL